MNYHEVTAVLSLEDREMTPMRRHWARALGNNVPAALLLQQIYFWYNNHGSFFKFKTPCQHELYKEGDSWVEELVTTRKQFDASLRVIGRKLNKAQWDSGEVQHDKLVEYRTDSSRLTWYRINEENMGKWFGVLYVKSERGFRKSPKGTLPVFREESIDPEESKSKNKTEPSVPEVSTGSVGKKLNISESSWSGDYDYLEAEVFQYCQSRKIFEDPLLPAYDSFPAVFEYIMSEQWRWWCTRDVTFTPEEIYDRVRDYLFKRYEKPGQSMYMYDLASLDIQRYLKVSYIRPVQKNKARAETKRILEFIRFLKARGFSPEEYIKWFREELVDKQGKLATVNLLLDKGIMAVFLESKERLHS